MPRYVALLRGVSPMNAKMPELKRCFEDAGFKNVVTVLSSGNVVFDSPKKPERSLEVQIEKAMEKSLGRSFDTIVRSQSDLLELLESDPYKSVKLSAQAKKVVTFLKESFERKIELPIKKDGVHIFSCEDKIICSSYLPHPKGPVFMVMLEKTFGKSITTRTWDTVGKVAKK